MGTALGLLITALVPWGVLWHGTSLQLLLGDGDAFVQFMPLRTLVAQMWSQGELPLWTPLLYSGSPLAADIQAGAWYPGTLLFLWFAPAVAFNLHTLLHLSLAGCGMYLLVRDHGCNVGSAALAGVVYQCSGYLWSHLSGMGMLNAEAWLPLLLWQTRRLAHAPTPALRIGLVISCYCTLLAGHPQMSCLSVAAWVGFALVTGFALARGRRAAFFWMLLTSAGVALLLAAVQLVPLLELIRQGTFAGRVTFEDFVAGSMSWGGLLVSGLSFRLGHLVRTSGADSGTAFVGFLPVVLAASTLLHAKDAGHRYWWALLIIGIVLAVGRYTPLPQLLYHLPLINTMRVPSRYTLFAVVGVAVLAGLGAHRLTARDHPVRRLPACMWITGVTLLLYHTIAFRWASDRLHSFSWQRLHDGFTGASWVALSQRFTPAEWGLGGLAVAGWAAGIAGLLWWLRRARGHALGAWLLFVITLFHLGIGRWVYTLPMDRLASSLSRVPAFPEASGEVTESGPVGADGLYRVASFVTHWPSLDRQLAPRADWHHTYVNVLGPDTNILGGVASAQGYGRLLRRAYADPLGMDVAGVFGDPSIFDRSRPVLDLLNIRYVLVAEGRHEAVFDDASRYGLVAHQPALATWIYERLPRPLPFWFVQKIRLMPEEEIAIVLRTGRDRQGSPVDLRQVALLDSSVGLPTSLPADALTDPPAVTEVSQYAPGVIRLRLRTSQPSFLVLSEMAYPGWKAWVDGYPVALYTTDALLRGVAVPAGASELVLRYQPASFRVGAALSLAGCAGLIVCGMPRPMRVT